MQNLPGNFRYALRQFRLSPVFTATAVLTLALGIGGITAIFAIIHAVMLRSLPVSDPAQLYRIGDGGRRPEAPIFVIRGGASGDITGSAQVVWQKQQRGPYISTPLI